MGECIGLDFGTTYSSISHLTKMRKTSDGVEMELEAVEIDNQEAIESVVVEDDKGTVHFGTDARDYNGVGNAKTFKGFKMLLGETRTEILNKHGFEIDQPEKITEQYLSNLISTYLESNNEPIDALVVGIPEVWNKTAIASRNKLLSILEKIIGLGKVKVESEPVLASAFFAFKHKEKTGKDFTGKILLIDYGGGTLDISLCDVQKDKPIYIDYKTGVGEAEHTKLGDAGFAYLEAVVKEAIGKAFTGEKDSDFYECMYKVEDALIKKSSEVTKHLKAILKGIKKEYDITLFPRPLSYHGNEYPVTYKMLIDVYNNTIHPVLEVYLNRVGDELTKRGIDYRDPLSDSFRIAIVGGFGNFYLVQNQISLI